jgi:hypothetical protein
MPRRKKSRRRKQKGGSDPKLHDYRDTGGSGESKGGLNEPLINKPQSSSKTKNLKNIYEKGKNILKGFTFKDMLLWVLLFVAIVIYSISITKGSSNKEDHMLVITYSILLVCSLFIGISYYFSKKGSSNDVKGSFENALKTMIPLLSSISGLIYIIMTYSKNLKIISNIGKYVEELSIFNNFIACMSFLQVGRLIIYFKKLGLPGNFIFDYIIFFICFIIQISLTIIISNKLESYRTDC